jgi:molybdate transport system substrate-binding protein
MRLRVLTWFVVLVAALLPILVTGQSAPPAALGVAAASDLQTALPELVARFEREHGAKVSVAFGSSGNFFAQIHNGAPFDLFFSADLDYPKRLVTDGFADADSLFQYATGRIVVWARKDGGVSIERGLASLSDARIRRIAVANPDHAPYGRAAIAALKHDGLYDAVRSKLVFGDNIAQTAQLVESGNADVGILALSLARGPALSARGTYVEIPATAHPPIDQAVVIVSASRNKAMARDLIAFLKRPEIAEMLHRFGFGSAQ